MWILTEDQTAAINLDHYMLILIQKAEVGVGVMAYADRGDMGTLLKVVDTEEDARRFIIGILASANGREYLPSPNNDSGSVG